VAFSSRLRELSPGDEGDRQWLYVPYDQLSAEMGPLEELPPERAGVVLAETTWKGRRRPYHRQKLAWNLANQRHFALEQARRGVAVRYLVGDRSFGELLAEEAADLGPLQVMVPAERELRVDLAPLVEEGLLEMVRHDGWLTSRETFRDSQDGPPWRMDAFYRKVRGESGILMEDGSPVGGRYSFDGENRECWPGEPPAPEPPNFEIDEITAAVGALIRSEFDDHPGELHLSEIPTTADDAERAWNWALEECMEHFGPYEDAMSSDSRTLFHTRISPLLNLHRLQPARVVRDVLELDIPLNSKEGFVRQVLGWREFMRHVHRETDGFRELPEGAPEVGDASPEGDPGAGGWFAWTGEEWSSPETAGDADSGTDPLDGGARPNALGAQRDVPPAFWGEPSGLNCLDEVVEAVWDEGWSHHITRLMVLSNIATLLGVEPRALSDWFWVAYVDAFDWVVEPNVLGMGTFGLGELFVTKPYVSGSNYIEKMSDYCEDCRFDPEEDCPLKAMYWAFLDEHEEELEDNRRMGLMLGTMRNRDGRVRDRDRELIEQVRRHLDRGERIEPEDLEEF